MLALEVVNDLLANEWTSPEQWKAIDGKFRWAGHEKKRESVRSVVEEEFSNPIADGPQEISRDQGLNK